MIKKFNIQRSQGIFFWIEGYSGSGKSTIGKNILNFITQKFGKTVLIHGNKFRKILNQKGFEKKDRISNSYPSSELIKLILDNKVNVIYTCVCLNNTSRKIYSKKSKNFFNILIKSDIKKIIKKKKKTNIYSLKDNIVGIHIKPEYPKKKIIQINNDLKEDIKIISKNLVKKISKIKFIYK